MILRVAIGCLLAALTLLLAGSAGAGPVVFKPPPPPRAVRVPVVRPSQQLSFWGVETNLQQSRDELQPAGPKNLRMRGRLQKTRSTDWK